MLLFPEPLLPMSKTFLFFAFLSCSDGGDSAEPAATAGAGAEPIGDGASISKGKIAPEEAMEGTRVEDEDKGEDEGEGDEGDDGCCCCSCRRLVRGLIPSTRVGNSMRLESIVAQLVKGTECEPCTESLWRSEVLGVAQAGTQALSHGCLASTSLLYLYLPPIVVTLN